MLCVYLQLHLYINKWTISELITVITYIKVICTNKIDLVDSKSAVVLKTSVLLNNISYTEAGPAT